MANKPLQSLKFPGLPDTYVVPQVDNTLSVAGRPADAKKVGDEFTDVKQDLIAQVEDIYSTMNIETVVDNVPIRSKNTNAVIDNEDGTYTIGTTDYGNILFNPQLKLPKGTYLLYGVEGGYAFLSTSTSHTSAIVTNSDESPKMFDITDDTLTYYLGFRTSAKPSASFTITPFLKRVIGTKTVQSYLINDFDPSVIIWEPGFYYDDGTASDETQVDIRSQTGLFIQVCKGSIISLKTIADGERLRVCKYSIPSEDGFIERVGFTNPISLLFDEDCYIRIYMYYSDLRTITTYTDLTDQLVFNILQYANESQTSEYVKNDELPTSWSNKIQTIQEAQGECFVFAVQTDTHYYNGYGENAGKNLKLLTNYIGFDFVANLGDVIRGYQDATIDSDANMRSAMTEIMHRYITGISCPFMVAMGNHDMNPYSSTPFSNAELWGRMFKPSFNTNPKAVTETGLMYYYTDFNDVRVIVLNTQDKTNQGFGVSAEQISWFANIALDTDKWVLVLSHVSLITGWTAGNNHDSSYEDIVSALQTFKTNNGKLIACMSGHTHLREYQTVDDILYITFRNGGNYAEAVLIDLDNKTIDMTMLGMTGTRSFTFD